MIDSWEELRKRRFEPIPGSQHTRWLTWRELAHEATPRFRRIYEREMHGVAVWGTHRAVVVSTRKYRARRGR